MWITSDWHFGHNKPFLYESRGFTNIRDHDNKLIEWHNLLVKPDDEVWVLGDLTLGDLDHGLECIARMNGKLHIVRGNHDTDRRISAYLQLPNVYEVIDGKYLKYKKYHFYLSHYPTITSNMDEKSPHQVTISLYGHTHQPDSVIDNLPFGYHVGIDSHQGCPVHFDNIIAEMTLSR